MRRSFVADRDHSKLRSEISKNYPRNPVRKKVFRLTLCAMLFALCCSFQAQQPEKIPRIAWITGSSLSSNAHRIEAFRQGLRELGYVEGKNIVFERRGADGNRDRQRELVAELVRLKVDVIVTSGGAPTRAAKEATSVIPIVIAQDTDPVGNGFVTSLARPGGNITGLSRLAPELSGKQLELLQEVISGLSKVAVLGRSSSGSYERVLEDVKVTAKALGLPFNRLRRKVPIILRLLSERQARGGLTPSFGSWEGHRQSSPKNDCRTRDQKRLPVIFEQAAFVDAGGLMSYGVSFTDLDRRSATYVDKILKGAKPADLPVEQPTKFELVINRKPQSKLV